VPPQRLIYINADDEQLDQLDEPPAVARSSEDNLGTVQLEEVATPVTDKVATPATAKLTKRIGLGPPHGKERRVRMVLMALLIAVAVGVAFWFTILRPPAAPVTEVMRGDAVAEVEGTGTVTADALANLASKIAGRVEQIYVNEGDFVQKGQILAALDEVDLHRQVAMARHKLAAAETLAQELQLEANRRQALLSKGQLSTTVEETQRFTRQYVVAQHEVEAAKAGLELAEYNLSLAQIPSLLNGVVTKRSANLGDAVVPGQQMFVVADTSVIYVSVNLDQNFTGKLRKGEPATVILRGRESQPLTGHVLRISPQANASTEETVAEVAFTVPPDEFQLGQWANVYIQVGEAKEALLVPRTVVMSMEEGMSVFVVGADDVVRRETVTVLAESPRRVLIAVAGNLRVHERVVLMPMGLRGGETVRPRPMPMTLPARSEP